MTKQRISTSCSWGVCRLLGCSRRAPSRRATIADGCLRMKCIAIIYTAYHHCCFHSLCVCLSIRRDEGLKLSLRTYRSNSVSFHFTQTFPEKFLSSPIMPCSRAFFNVRNRAFPTSDCLDRRSIDGPDHGSANRKGQGATRRSLQIAAHVRPVFSRLPTADRVTSI